MATVALSVVGFVVGGPFGAQIGAMVGGVIDSFIFAPNIKGPRLTDLSVQASSYGQNIPLLYGNRVRIAGEVIWSTGLIETTTKKRAGKGGPTQTTYSYRTSIAVLLGGTPIDGIRRIWANGKIIWESTDVTLGVGSGHTESGAMNAIAALVGHIIGGSKAFASMVVYPGDGTQMPDPTIQSYLGVENTPAYRHSAYVVIKDLQLADFGNALPNLEFEVAPQESITVGEALKDLCARASTPIYSTGSLTMPLDGFAIAQAQNVIAAIQPLALAYSFDLAEAHGQIRVRPRGEGMAAVLADGQRAARESDNGGSPPAVGQFETLPPVQMPRSATVSYQDADADFQVGSQSSFRQLGADENNISVEVPMALTADRARKIADRVLWGAWAGRRSTTEQVSDKWVRTLGGAVVGIRTGDFISPMRLMRVQRGDNGIIEWTMQYEDPEVYRSNAPAQSFTPVIRYLPPPGDSLFLPIDSPLLRSTDDDEGFYYAVGTTSSGWRGAEVLRSSDDGASYQTVESTGLPATVGAASALPPAPADFWDRGNRLTVAMLNPSLELESVTEAQVLNGQNAAWLGNASGHRGEIIQFANATLIAEGVYELDTFLRGRRGTEYAIEGHGTDEYLVMLDPGPVVRANYGAGDWDRERDFKAVSTLLSESDVAAVPFTNSGEGKRPLSPVHISGLRDLAGDLAISWTRRTRLTVPGLGLGPVPVGEETESYEVDILISGSAVRTIASTAPTASYSAADQITDGITPGDPIDIAVYQLSAIRGRGHPGNATV